MHQETPTHVQDLEQFVTEQSTDDHTGAAWYALCPTLSGAVTITRALDAASTPNVRFLGGGTALRKASRRFPVGARLGEATADPGPRVVEACPFPTTLVGPSGVAVVVTASDAQCVSVATDERHDRLRAGAERAWTDADDTDLSVPSLDTLLGTAERELGPAFREAVETAVQVADSRSPDGTVDGVGAALLAAAARERLFRDVSRWATHQGLASGATCSRRRGELAEADAVVTSEEATSPGRPTLRCHLTDAARRRYESEGVGALIAEHCL
ncbi:MAG: hypothetical protein J07HB67_01566 [halophilic archaeon J07HB67]|jgi:hypothetical protein|nr:MAG: hypothetical protein J07HB67_01566 [halophilic archaeon J07HB67]